MSCLLLKRKRSDSELSFSSSTTLASPPRLDGERAIPTYHAGCTPLHLPSRTMKRFRNNRPSEAEVHKRTLNILYSAQQHAVPASVTSAQVVHLSSAIQSPGEPDQQGPSKQASLHSFWNIPRSVSASSPAADLPSSGIFHPHADPEHTLVCEDCNAPVGGEGDYCTMDMDGNESGQERCCLSCGKVVCFSCSVSNLGEQRRCLTCASRNAWVEMH